MRECVQDEFSNFQCPNLGQVEKKNLDCNSEENTYT